MGAARHRPDDSAMASSCRVSSHRQLESAPLKRHDDGQDHSHGEAGSVASCCSAQLKKAAPQTVGRRCAPCRETDATRQRIDI